MILDTNRNRLDILKAASNIAVPHLIVHGSNDTTVPLNAAEQLHEAHPESELLIVEGGDHTFGGKHPWTEATLPEQTSAWIDKAIAFALA